MADAWYQTSGEMKALYYQGYNTGKLRLDEALAKSTDKKPAIILDLDETVLIIVHFKHQQSKLEKDFLINGMSGCKQQKRKQYQVLLIS